MRSAPNAVCGALGSADAQISRGEEDIFAAMDIVYVSISRCVERRENDEFAPDANVDGESRWE